MDLSHLVSIEETHGAVAVDIYTNKPRVDPNHNAHLQPQENARSACRH